MARPERERQPPACIWNIKDLENRTVVKQI
jgi:hypothetical protein